MNDEPIRVKVNSYGPGRSLGLVWIDPVSGRKRARSAKTRDWREAERLAGELEKELRAGRGGSPSKITWQEFRRRYMAEKLPALSAKTRQAFKTAANHLERVLDPGRLCKLTAGVLSRFTAKLREEGMGESTIGTNLRHLRAMLSWGVDVGALPAVPKLAIPRAGGARARAPSGEEFDRLIAAVPKVRPQDASVWTYYLRGLWLSGLRLEESLALSWDEEAPFAVDLSGRRPAFRIEAAAQKARRDERLPMTPDFAELLFATPEAERVGPVFKLVGLTTGVPIVPQRVSRVVSAIGERAGVVVATVQRRKRNRDANGKVISSPAKKFASAHDLRRAFGTRWARRVMPAVLQRLMRHAEIATTMKYYVTIDADAVADELWGREWNPGNKPGNTHPERCREENGAPADVSTESYCE